MKNIYLFSLLFLLSFTINAQHETLDNQDQTQELSKKVASLFNENKIPEAFQTLEQYWPLPKNELDALQEKTIKYMNILENRFGKQIGYIKVKDENISDIALRETYIIQFSYSAIRIIFTYYKSEQGWFINAFKWDDSFEEEFQKTN